MGAGVGGRERTGVRRRVGDEVIAHLYKGIPKMRLYKN